MFSPEVGSYKRLAPFKPGLFTNLIEPEVWKDIPSHVGKYQISSYGNVRSLTRHEVYVDRARTRKGREMKQKVNTEGYCIIHLRSPDMHISVHRLVAEAFIENTDGKPTVNHIDGDKQNNLPSNLEWSTHQEQRVHAIKNGLSNKTMTRFSDDFRREVKSHYDSSGESIKQTARHFGINEKSASSFCKGVLSIRKVNPLVGNEDFIRNVYFNQGWTLQKIAKHFNSSTSVACRFVQKLRQENNLKEKSFE